MKKRYPLLLSSIIIIQLRAQTIDVNSPWAGINGGIIPDIYGVPFPFQQPNSIAIKYN